MLSQRSWSMLQATTRNSTLPPCRRCREKLSATDDGLLQMRYVEELRPSKSLTDCNESDQA